MTTNVTDAFVAKETVITTQSSFIAYSDLSHTLKNGNI